MDLIAAGYGSSSSDSEGDSSRPSKAPKLTTSTSLTVNVAPDVSLEVKKTESSKAWATLRHTWTLNAG